MKRIPAVARAFFLCFALAAFTEPALFAQEEDDEDDTQEIQDQHENQDEVQELHYYFAQTQRGDQNIRISLAPQLAVYPFGNPFKDGTLKWGGIGTLGYHYFVMSKLAVGIDAGFGFNVTVGSNILNYVPILSVVTYQPSAGNFEFPMSLGFGFAWEMYSGYTYWPGLVLKPEIGVHYRINPSWSVGVDVAYMYMPQFRHRTHAPTVHAQFVNAQLVARYYF